MRRFAGIMAVHDRRLVLVRERHPHWGGEFWNIPSGQVESHEAPAVGAARELAEETGLVVAADSLLLVGTSSTTSNGRRSEAWNFTTVIEDPTLAVDDPDRSVLEARWFTRDEAMDHLARLPYRPISEPVVAYLSEAVELGSHWTYDAPDAEPVITGGAGADGEQHSTDSEEALGRGRHPA